MTTEKTLTQADVDKAIKDALAEAKAEHEAETQGLKDKNRELLGKLRQAGDIKPEDLASAEQRAEQAEKDLAEARKQVKTLTGERDNAVKALEAESGFTRGLLVENGLKDTLIKGGVKDEDYLDALVTKFSKGATVVVDGDKRKAMLGDKELGAVVAEYLGTDAGKKFVSAPSNGGGGAPGGKGGEGGKTMGRAAFDILDPGAKAAFMKEGGKLVDAAA